MRILILGGTVFLGRHVAAEALARGHELTLYTRGLHGADCSRRRRARHGRPRRRHPAARPRVGRRDRHLGLRPRARRGLRGADVGHYVFVSTCNAYPGWPEEPVDEDSPMWQDGEGYGPDKAAAERASVLPPRATVRAGLIVGPHDNVFRLPWWVRRIAAGRRRARARAARTSRCS